MSKKKEESKTKGKGKRKIKTDDPNKWTFEYLVKGGEPYTTTKLDKPTTNNIANFFIQVGEVIDEKTDNENKAEDGYSYPNIEATKNKLIQINNTYDELSETYEKEDVSKMYLGILEDVMADRTINLSKLSNFLEAIISRISNYYNVKLSNGGTVLYEGSIFIGIDSGCYAIFRNALKNNEQLQLKSTTMIAQNMKWKNKLYNMDKLRDIMDSACGNFRKANSKIFTSTNKEKDIEINYGFVDIVFSIAEKFKPSAWKYEDKTIDNAIEEYKLRQKYGRYQTVYFSKNLGMNDMDEKLVDNLDKMYVISDEAIATDNIPRPITENYVEKSMTKLYNKQFEGSVFMIHFNEKYIDHLDEILFLEFDDGYNITTRKTLIPLIMPPK